MYKEILRSLGDQATLFPLVAILLFMGIFVGLLIWVIRMDKSQADELADIPFSDDPIDPRLKRDISPTNGQNSTHETPTL